MALTVLTACASADRAASRAPDATALGDGDDDRAEGDVESARRPLLVFVHAAWCAACRRIAPAVASLRDEYAGRITYVDLDVTDDDAIGRARETAAQHGLRSFFLRNGARTGAVILGRRHREVGRFVAELRAGPYRAALDEAFASWTNVPSRGPP